MRSNSNYADIELASLKCGVKKIQRINWTVILAVFAMLCQSLMPTIVYQQAAGNPVLLSAVAKAFGIHPYEQRAQDHSHHHGHDHDRVRAQPTHEHHVKCALCLADVMLIGVPTPPFFFPSIPPNFSHTYFIFATAFFPVDLGTPLARGPPLS